MRKEEWVKSTLREFFKKSAASFPLEQRENGTRSSWLARYGIAAFAVLVSFGIRFALNPFLGDEARYILFVPAIFAAGLSGGLGPALFASLFSLVLASHFFGPVLNSWIPHNLHDLFAGLTYLFSALIVVCLADAARIRTQQLHDEVEQRKRVEEDLRRSEKLLRMTTEGACVGLWTWDIPTSRVEWNAIEYEQFGLEANSPLSLKTFLNCIHPDDREWVSTELQKCLRENSELDIQHRILRPDGSIRWNHCKGRPTYVDGKPVNLSGMSLDITEQKKSEESLRQAKNALDAHMKVLEQRVTERTEQLNRAVRDMEDFCYSIAHDLRAPLRAVRGFAQALVEDHAPALDESAFIYCDRIQIAANRMDELISGLLAFGRLSHLEVPTTTVDLTTEIEKVLAHSAGELQRRHAEIELDKPLPSVCADAPVLDQVIENLINNAIKFVPPERPPHVHIYAEPHDGFVRVWIEDNGIGIAPEHQKKIFGAFERLHTNEAYPGTGIGLALVRRGVEKMGGHVGIESEVGKGSRFWIELPGAVIVPT